MASGREICLNDVCYRWSERPVVVVCSDGGDPDYLDRAVEGGIVPNMARFMRTGFSATAECVVPSFTCPNNVSIIAGPALGAWDIRKFLFRSGDGQGRGHDRPRVT
jgi:hypothetical protein